MEKTYYVYLNSPTGTELIGRGTKETCEKIKAEKDKEWQPSYLWNTEISEAKIKENNLWD